SDLDAAKVGCSTDHCPFMLQGVPTLNLLVDDAHYEDIHHLATDTSDKVKEGWLAEGAAVLAVTAWLAAEQPARLAPRISHEAVAQHLAGNDALPGMTATGLWTP